jgi:hypothetical protein
MSSLPVAIHDAAWWCLQLTSQLDGDEAARVAKPVEERRIGCSWQCHRSCSNWAWWSQQQLMNQDKPLMIN